MEYGDPQRLLFPSCLPARLPVAHCLKFSVKCLTCSSAQVVTWAHLPAMARTWPNPSIRHDLTPRRLVAVEVTLAGAAGHGGKSWSLPVKLRWSIEACRGTSHWVLRHIVCNVHCRPRPECSVRSSPVWWGWPSCSMFHPVNHFLLDPAHFHHLPIAIQDKPPLRPKSRLVSICIPLTFVSSSLLLLQTPRHLSPLSRPSRLLRFFFFYYSYSTRSSSSSSRCVALRLLLPSYTLSTQSTITSPSCGDRFLVGRSHPASLGQPTHQHAESSDADDDDDVVIVFHDGITTQTTAAITAAPGRAVCSPASAYSLPAVDVVASSHRQQHTGLVTGSLQSNGLSTQPQLSSLHLSLRV